METEPIFGATCENCGTSIIPSTNYCERCMLKEFIQPHFEEEDSQTKPKPKEKTPEKK